ncbi:MAG: hypothetical protein M9908_04935 [Phyllobacteriaceae bacterium]|nr:hypothetical protein [Phyllobacteriaceae bacterium]
MANTVEETARLLGRTHDQRFDRLMPGYHRQLRNASAAQEAAQVEKILSQSFMALLIKLALAMTAVALVIFASASYYGAIVAKGGHETETVTRQVAIANEVLNVPANMIRFRSQRKSRALERLDLYAHWPTMQGYSDDRAAIFDDMKAGAPLLFISIEPRDMTTDMSGRVSTIYEKFFAGPPIDAGHGLVRRAFSSESAYFMEDLYYQMDSPYPFAARCIRESDRIAAPYCIRDIHIGKDLMVSYRFHANLIGEWMELDRAVRETVNGFLARG